METEFSQKINKELSEMNYLEKTKEKLFSISNVIELLKPRDMFLKVYIYK